jgi:hypothetical protein
MLLLPSAVVSTTWWRFACPCLLFVARLKLRGKAELHE